ncbi:MAG: inositol monophosphatase family protein [Lentisphaeria bacterium]|nr:inositol monophosphatase family protein [Lentisphaeria bacterium]
MDNLTTRIAETAVSAAKAAGELLRVHYGKELVVHGTPGKDVKLEVDKLAESAIKDMIQDRFPDHAVLAEESGASGERGAEFLWVVDPLDGTVNYFHGLPYYCTSIACYRMAGGDTCLPGLGEPVVGVVYAPPTDELFVGIHTRGATLNGASVHVADTADLSDTIFSMGFGKNVERGRDMVRVASHITDHVRKVRCLGAAAYDISNVAAGRLGGFYEGGLRSWDIAAAAVILQEAGGVMSVEEFEPTWWRVLATTPALLSQLQAMI